MGLACRVSSLMFVCIHSHDNDKEYGEMICEIKQLITWEPYQRKLRKPEGGLMTRIKFWLCQKRGTHDFEMVLNEWRDGNVSFDDWGKGPGHSEVPTVDLKEAARWCNRRTILRCAKCGFEYESSFSGVKGCGGHTWIAGKEWPIEWQCLPWGDPHATVAVGTSKLPASVMQINDPKMAHLRDEILV